MSLRGRRANRAAGSLFMGVINWLTNYGLSFRLFQKTNGSRYVVLYCYSQWLLCDDQIIILSIYGLASPYKRMRRALSPLDMYTQVLKNDISQSDWNQIYWEKHIPIIALQWLCNSHCWLDLSLDLVLCADVQQGGNIWRNCYW